MHADRIANERTSQEEGLAPPPLLGLDERGQPLFLTCSFIDALLCFAMLQLLASEHSRVLTQESLLRLHHICPIVSTQ